MFFQFLKNKKYLAGVLITLLAFSFTPVFADEVLPATETPAPIEETAVPVETPPPTEIVTGDAVSLSDTTNEMNTNEAELTTDNQPAQTEVEETTPTLLEEVFASTTISNENEAVVENNVETTAETGNNSAGSPNPASQDGQATITTGDSLASANIINVVNTNIFNSSGFFFLLNALFGQIGTIDIRAAMNNASSSAPSLTSLCGTNFCNATTTSITEIENINTAEVVNNVVVRSSTGSNGGTGDDSTINTGDAYASANVVNVANTNIIDSNYALMVFNNFGGWNGDFILPNKDFFDNFFLKKHSDSNNGAGTSALSISNQNEANIENNVETIADTGGNSTTGDDSEISTGDATAGSNVHNQVNTNLFGGKSLRILFRITGKWSGNIFGLPSGVQWRETPAGVEIFGDEDFKVEPHQNGEVQPLSPTASTTVDINNNNTASITNNVSVYALTGDNKIEGDGASIQTGDALAAANVVNLANTNIVGQNWLYAIFNIFGDWNGNVSFGEPDLWLGARAESLSGGFGPGARVAYHFTVANRGDADATNVKIKNIFESSFINFGGGNESEWDIGALSAGGSADFTYTATIADNLPFGDTELNGSATVRSFENDANPDDNTDRVIIIASRARPTPVYSGLNVPFTSDPILSVVKANDASTTTPLVASSTVKYKVVIKNDGGEAYRSVLVDTLKNEKGEVINEQSWDLDVIFPGEEITVDYTVFFNASTTDGVYTNYAQVKALGRHPSLNPFYGWFADSNVATSSITIANPKPPEPWVYLSPPENPPVGGSVLHTEEIKREMKPIIKPTKETNIFPPLQSFEPFDSDFFGKMVFISRSSYDLNQTAAVFAGLPFVMIPRNLNILFLLIIGAALATSQREPIRRLRHTFTSFLS
ncbi:MAG: hypothetical protein AAB537_00275 [Patescibacteria group bacterium]